MGISDAQAPGEHYQQVAGVTHDPAGHADQARLGHQGGGGHGVMHTLRAGFYDLGMVLGDPWMPQPPRLM